MFGVKGQRILNAFRWLTNFGFYMHGSIAMVHGCKLARSVHTSTCGAHVVMFKKFLYLMPRHCNAFVDMMVNEFM